MPRYKFVVSFETVGKTELSAIVKDDDLSVCTSTGLQFRNLLAQPAVRFVSCNVYDNETRKFVSLDLTDLLDVLAAAAKIEKLKREGGQL